MTNAEATIRSSIISGLSHNAHITKASATHSEMQTKDIMDAIFHPSVRWSVQEYLNELEAKK